MLIDHVGQSCPAASKRAILAVGFRWCCFIYLHYHIPVVVYWYSYIMYYLKSYNSLWMNHFIIVHKRWTFVSSYMNTFYLICLGVWCFCERSFFFCFCFVQLHVLVDVYVLQIQGVPIRNWPYGICLLKGNGTSHFTLNTRYLICRIISWLIDIRGKGNGVKYLLRFWFLCGPSECGMLWFYLMNCKIRLKLIWNEWCEFVWRDHVKGS